MIQKKKQPNPKNISEYKRGWPVGVLLLLLGGAAVFFGLHPHYRILSAFFAAAALLTIWKKEWWHLITAVPLLSFTVFLWTFGPNGYRWASLLPFSVAVFLLILRFCPKAIAVAASVLAALALTALIIL